MMRKKWFAYPYVLWMVLFTIVPIFIVLFFSLSVPGASGIELTLQNFKDALTGTFMRSLLLSLQIAFITTVICLILGYPFAFILSRMKRKTRSIFTVLLMMPMWMNFLVRTYAWMVIFNSGEAGLINSFIISLGLEPVEFLYNNTAVVLVMIYNYLPFMILPIYTVLSKMDRGLLEAAQDLGAGPFKVFTTLILPMSIPGIVSGITMVFMPAVTTFAIPRLVGGAQSMIGDIIEVQFLQIDNKNLGSALSMILMVLILLSMALLNKFDKDNEAGGIL